MTRRGDETILTDKYGRCFRKAETSPSAGADVREDGLDSWVLRVFGCFCFESKAENHTERPPAEGRVEPRRAWFYFFHKVSRMIFQQLITG